MNTPTEYSKAPDIGCLEAIEALYAWLDGELEDPATVAGIEQHLSHCSSCCSRVEMERALTARIRKSPGTRASKALQSRMKDLLDGF
jgi:anti-sigma factor (TIGR02949 family)